MTEAEWLACESPQRMLQFLRGRIISERKLRLFACACYRLLWNQSRDQSRLKAVEAAERFADDGRTNINGWLLYHLLDDAAKGAFRGRSAHPAYAAGGQYRRGAHLIFDADVAVGWATAHNVASYARSVCIPRSAENEIQCQLLRDLFAVFVGPVAVAPSWFAWNGRTVLQLARVIYEERRFEDLPILADALEEAGCTDAEILAHCRSQTEHVRGCWVVDALLGKE